MLYETTERRSLLRAYLLSYPGGLACKLSSSQGLIWSVATKSNYIGAHNLQKYIKHDAQILPKKAVKEI